MFNQKIDDFHAPEVSLEVLLSVWREQIAQRWRCTGALGDGLQKPRRWLRDAVIAQERFAECRRFSFLPRDLLIAGRAERTDDFIDQLWIVRCVNSQRIAHFKGQTPSRQIELEMARVLLRFRTAQAAIHDHASRKWIRACVAGGRSGGGRGRNGSSFGRSKEK